MIPFKAGERAVLDDALIQPHQVRVKVYVTDLQGRHRSDVSDNLLGGQIDVDVTAEVSRTLSMTLLDPKGEIALDSDDPSQAAMYMDNMIQIAYGIKAGTMTQFIEVPVFTGPIVALSRNDNEIEVTAYGKEHLAQALLWHNFNAKKGANKISVIKRLMRQGAGESNFLLPEMPRAILRDDLSVVALRQTPWKAARSVAESMDRVLYYDGAGRLRMRAKAGNNVYTFAGGDDGMLMSVPSVSFSTEQAKNAVVVKGKTTVQRKNAANLERSFSAKAVVERNHPLSPWRLGRNDVPRYLVEQIENNKITNARQAKEIAENELMRLLEQQTEIAFDALPVPYLEEWDRVKVIHEDFAAAFSLRQFSIPLTVGDTMSIGYNRRLLTVKRGRINTKRNSRTKKVRKNKK